MAALVNKAAENGGIRFLRQSLNLLFRSITTSTASAAATDISDPKKSDRSNSRKKKKKKNLFEVAQFLPNWGIGFKMAKNHWRDVSYEITKINLYKGGRHGKAWGIRHKAGLPAADSPVKISGVHKRGWKYFPDIATKAITNVPKAGQIQA